MLRAVADTGRRDDRHRRLELVVGLAPPHGISAKPTHSAALLLTFADTDKRLARATIARRDRRLGL